MAALPSSVIPPTYIRVGYKFSPKKGDLIQLFLKKKILEEALPNDVIPTIDDLYSKNPDQLPLTIHRDLVENEWYFFTTKPNNNNDVMRTNDGYYSVKEGLEETVFQEGVEVGYMRTLAYILGENPPKGKKSRYTIYEFRINPEIIPATKHDVNIRAKVSTVVVVKVVRAKERKRRKRKYMNDDGDGDGDGDGMKSDQSSTN